MAKSYENITKSNVAKLMQNEDENRIYIGKFKASFLTNTLSTNGKFDAHSLHVLSHPLCNFTNLQSQLISGSKTQTLNTQTHTHKHTELETKRQTMHKHNFKKEAETKTKKPRVSKISNIEN